MTITQAIIRRAKSMSDAQTVKAATSVASTELTAAQGHAPVVIDLVARARSGEKQAWDALVERYASLIWSICRRSELGPDHTEDVAQGVWLRLVDQLGNIRDPAALPGWLATTTRRECGRVLREASRTRATAHAADFETVSGEQVNTAEDDLMAAERHAALREAVAQLPADDRQLIALLIADPPMPYAKISARLGIPVGSIGPKRLRCLNKIRHYPSVAALISAAAEAA
ncbi:MAG TPA: sigma-70 family RNA polymerase sigma factor [Trebonia sp.]|jgi:RNA polymerase sigma factor (sigma-70 family)